MLLLVWGVVLLATQAGRDAAALGDGLLLTLAVLVGGSAAVALVIGGVDALWRVAVAPLAHVEAEATGGVAVLGRGRLGAGLRRVEPRFPLPTLRPYAVVVPRRRGLTVSFGDWGVVVPWARSRGWSGGGCWWACVRARPSRSSWPARGADASRWSWSSRPDR
ncbi:hypothetical protein C5C71_07815 [Rathayibacter sp. AY1C1]|uniref:hypothetical protein n=1 Tax=Rathayibacter sp. AY1C1 TaxID=2080534 RepID=UPI000CE7202B|nr:hypothetical protein [Rathayibacter sp. AY1C1]PPH11118.1 hypothetical protein C5C71_07815 [Rathayibacter sp. AY1C1]